MFLLERRLRIETAGNLARKPAADFIFANLIGHKFRIAD